MLFLQHIGWGMTLAACVAAGQSFEAASVKPATAPRGRYVAPSGGPGTNSPGRIHYPGVTLQFLVLRAYDITSYQIAGPDWLDSDRFDVDATLPAQAGTAEFRVMLQNLLAERFRLAIHRELRDLPGYALIVVRKGPKFQTSAGAPVVAEEGSAPVLKLGADRHFLAPDRQGVFFQFSGHGGARANFRSVTMADLAKWLQSRLKRPVIEATGLSARYDFALDFATEGLDFESGRIPVSPGSEEGPPDIATALQEQLGLKLEERKIPSETIVIDHIERAPTGN